MSGLFVPTTKQGQPKLILSLGFHTSNPSTPSPYHTDMCRDIKTLHDALNLFDEMLKFEPKPFARLNNKLLNILVKMGHYSHVILLFKKLTLSGGRVNEYTMGTVINCYSNLKEADLGFAVFASFLKRGYFLDVVTITSLIKGLFLEENVEKAVELFKKVIKDKLCEINEFTLSTMLNGLCKCGNVVNAVMLLEVLEQENCELNVVVYNSTLSIVL
ncbi:hypothetical protein Leryth_004590 [Lithospermum erythrorhizon]|nr:hypothetical protein Leryth_004590 [Lithospermum erythrorhizon]